MMVVAQFELSLTLTQCRCSNLRIDAGGKGQINRSNVLIELACSQRSFSMTLGASSVGICWQISPIRCLVSAAPGDHTLHDWMSPSMLHKLRCTPRSRVRGSHDGRGTL